MNPVALPDTTFLVPLYLVYAVISVALTVWLARTLAQNGAVFLADVFKDNEALAKAVNKLLVVGFYLLNLGYASLLLASHEAPTLVSAIETLSKKLGLLLLSLGGMHFFNLYLFHRIRRRAQLAELPPPVMHHAKVPADGHAPWLGASHVR